MHVSQLPTIPLRRRRVRAGLCQTAMLVAFSAMVTTPSFAHLVILETQRSGAAPCQVGTGWFVECFYALPDDAAANLLAAEAFVSEASPTFTFRTQFIDWPAGPVAYGFDADYGTLGDLLDGEISELSDPGALDLPMDHFLIRATGYLNVRLEDSEIWPPPPVWMDFGIAVFDGGRVRMSTTTITRILFPQPPNGYATEDASIESPGVYRVEVTFLNHYDPDNEFGAERAGIEFLTCHTDGMKTPSGFLLPCNAGDAKLPPPELFYDAKDILPVLPFDFDVDNDVDLRDLAGFQNCFTGPGQIGAPDDGCRTFAGDDNDIDLNSFADFIEHMVGPEVCVP